MAISDAASHRELRRRAGRPVPHLRRAQQRKLRAVINWTELAILAAGGDALNLRPVPRRRLFQRVSVRDG